MGIRVSIDVDELVKRLPGGIEYVFSVPQNEFDTLVKRFGMINGVVMKNNVVFKPKPSVTAELDRLLTQQVSPSSNDRFVMSLDVWQQYCEEKGLTPKPLENIKMYERPYYRGVFIETQDEIDGGVQLKCDYYVKGNL